MDNKDLENEIEKIKERNKKVELDKAWETSWTRKICICTLTYIVVVIYTYIINKFNNICYINKKCYKYMVKFISTSDRIYIINNVIKNSKKYLGKK